MKLFPVFISGFLLASLFSCNQKDNNQNTGPDANFSVTGYEIASPATVAFINTSASSTSYLWNFGDGSTSTLSNPTHVYLAGTFQVGLKVTGPGGTDSICKIVDIEPPVAANKSSFSYFFDKCSGYPVGAQFKSINPASTNTSWDFSGVLNISRDPIIQFVLPGDYTVKYSSQIAGVRDTVIRIIRIQ